nr:hypothetical protein [Tanacetum cinerariifolium]
MFGTVPPIPPPLRSNPGNTVSPNRIDPILVDNTKSTTTTNVVQNVVNEDLPQLLDSKGGSHVTNVHAFNIDNFSSWKDSDSDVEEDTRSSSEFLADLNAEFHDRALLANQKRFYKRRKRKKEGCNFPKESVIHHERQVSISSEITFNSESECDNQEPLSPLLKLSGVEQISTSKDVITLADLTQTSHVFKKTKKVFDKKI